MCVYIYGGNLDLITVFQNFYGCPQSQYSSAHVISTISMYISLLHIRVKKVMDTFYSVGLFRDGSDLPKESMQKGPLMIRVRAALDGWRKSCSCVPMISSTLAGRKLY